ncbi:AI-2E family transporter [Candidatus Pacearchaeota archaeon]|nr:AI-2E family transporter [Candidatus Pacearchaeota archaeon]
MIDKERVKDLVTYILIIGLLILAAIILRPIIIAIVYGLLFAYILFPVNKLFKKIFKNEFLSAFLVCLALFIIIAIVMGLIIGTLLDQLIDFYFSLSSTDLTGKLTEIFNKLPFPAEVTSSLADNLRTSISNLLFSFLDQFNKFILDLPELALRFLVFLFVFFFALKDGEKGINYLKSVSPLRKDTEEKFLYRFKNITNSVLLGQILVGIIQGLTAGVGFFIFGVPNAFLFTIIAIFASIIPLIGPWLVWLPISLYLFTVGRPEIAFGFFIYNLFLTSLIDNVIRPFIVSKRTELNSAIIVVGMVGGFLVFGILGLIIGPLIIAYILLMLEIYKKKNLDPILKKN